MTEDKAIVPNEQIILTQPDDYSEFNLSEEARTDLNRTVKAFSTGIVSTSPIICKGPDQCSFKSRCPIYRNGNTQYPKGKQCIVEAQLALQKFDDYVQEFNIKGKVEQSPTLRSLISELVDLDLAEFRINLVLSGANGESNGTLLIEQTIGVDLYSASTRRAMLPASRPRSLRLAIAPH